MPEKMRATIISKGQITPPAALRRRSIFERLDELKLPYFGRPLTQEDIDESIAAAMLEKHGKKLSNRDEGPSA